MRCFTPSLLQNIFKLGDTVCRLVRLRVKRLGSRTLTEVKQYHQPNDETEPQGYPQ